MSRLLRVLSAGVAFFALLASPALAADSISLSFGDDPTEEVPVTVTASWTSDQSENSIFVTVKPAGSLGCADSHSEDDPNSTTVIDTRRGNNGSVSVNRTFEDPGDYTFCGYLQNSSSDTAARKSTGPVTLTVRSARATVALQVPTRVDAEQRYTLAVPVTAELSRRVYVTVKPVGGRGCEANLRADDPQSTTIVEEQVQGSQTVQRSVAASETPGRYLLCAYVQESGGDLAPEATASTEFEVGPDPCVVARDALTVANGALASARNLVSRRRRAVKRYAAAVRRTRGAGRRRNARRLRRARARLRSANRVRGSAAADVRAREAEATQACGG
ncbi:MAG TPA: hypothetical protein VF529_14980 [Solirubrobacteraceae bacterium]|jgi:hypothetical protein